MGNTLLRCVGKKKKSRVTPIVDVCYNKSATVCEDPTPYVSAISPIEAPIKAVVQTPYPELPSIAEDGGELQLYKKEEPCIDDSESEVEEPTPVCLRPSSANTNLVIVKPKVNHAEPESDAEAGTVINVKSCNNAYAETEAEVLVREEQEQMENEMRKNIARAARQKRREEVQRVRSENGINLVDTAAGVLNLLSKVELLPTLTPTPPPVLSPIHSPVQSRDASPERLPVECSAQPEAPTVITTPTVRTRGDGMSRPTSRLFSISIDIPLVPRVDTPRPNSNSLMEKSNSDINVTAEEDCNGPVINNSLVSGKQPWFHEQVVLNKLELAQNAETEIADITSEVKKKKKKRKKKKKKTTGENEIVLTNQLSMKKIEQFLETREHIDKTEFDLVVQNLVNSNAGQEIFPESRKGIPFAHSTYKIPRMPTLPTTFPSRDDSQNAFAAALHTTRSAVTSRFPVISDRTMNERETFTSGREFMRRSPVGGNVYSIAKLPGVAENDASLVNKAPTQKDYHTGLATSFKSQKSYVFSRNIIDSIVQGSNASMKSERSRVGKASSSRLPVVANNCMMGATARDPLPFPEDDVSAEALISCFHGNSHKDMVEVEPYNGNLSSLPPILSKPLVSSHAVTGRIEIDDNEIRELFGCQDDPLTQIQQLRNTRYDNGPPSSLICQHKALQQSCKFCNRPPSRGGRVLMNWLNTKKLKRLKKQRPPDEFIEE